MPLNKKGKKIKKAMTKQYGKKKGKKVFYAMENSGKLRKVTKAKGGKDMGTVAGETREARDEGAIAERMAKTQQAANLKKSKDVPFKKPIGFKESIALSTLGIPFLGTGINLAAKQQYKGRQRFAKKQGLYRDFYKTTGKTLQPNAPIGKDYLKEAGFGKRPDMMPTRDDSPPILPPVSQAAQVNEPILPLNERRLGTVSPTGRFGYTVGLRKGGLLRQGKPKLAKKGWK